ncbi:MAG: hypothetical protein JO092_06965 [Candidatus Eremiobacteraeota bacterium]|nr:hypothetical protein [Candidatus Eremiobacteraeota bacterium]MBV8374605.1 hypothetical protein [Candidatus Eremiobacteraeota bacterium]
MKRASRGQAVAESVIFLPLALLALWGMIWVAQYSLSAERVQSSLRYSGLIANQVDPYQQFSLYVMYTSVNSSASPLPSPSCNGTTTDALTNTNTYPGPQTVPFYVNTPAPAATGCANQNTTHGSYQTVAGVTLNNPALVVSNVPQVTTNVSVPGFMQPIFGGISRLPASAQLNFMRPVDMGTMVGCFQGFKQSLGASVAPTPQSAQPTFASPVPMAEPIPAQTAMPLSNGC